MGARLRQREVRAKKERKFEKQAQINAKRQYGNHSPPRDIRLDSRYHFPECGSDTPPNMTPRLISKVLSFRYEKMKRVLEKCFLNKMHSEYFSSLKDAKLFRQNAGCTSKFLLKSI